MKKTICFHLYNDYSIPPKVLLSILKGLHKKGYKIHLITSRGGVLDELNGMENIYITYYKYYFSTNLLLTMWQYITRQIYTFFIALKYIFHRKTVFYINTLLPIGPALAGRLIGKKVIYHYHENAFAKGFFHKRLCRIMQILGSYIICVSAYQSNFLTRKKKVFVIPNTLSSELRIQLQQTAETPKEQKIILMLCSLKLYTGIFEFLQLSKRLPYYIFHLVINDTKENIEVFIKKYLIKLPRNLKLFDRQNDIAPFFKQAFLVLNLSNKNELVENFGFTVLEAITAGLPVIVPTEGGIAEMVEDGVNGYKIDVQDLDKIEKQIDKILSEPTLYQSLSKNAKRMAKSYDEEKMINKIAEIINK